MEPDGSAVAIIGVVSTEHDLYAAQITTGSGKSAWEPVRSCRTRSRYAKVKFKVIERYASRGTARRKWTEPRTPCAWCPFYAG
jgi:hypothetical protein